MNTYEPTPTRSTTNMSVSFGAIAAVGECDPYASDGGMINSRRPPTFMPGTPWSQPWITWPCPSGKLKVCPRFQEASNSFLVVHEYPSYCTVTDSPALAAAPVPTIRSLASS